MDKLIFIFFILTSSLCFSENEELVNFYKVDSATYNDYINGKWKEVIKVTEIALKNNIDYYYLRVRAGMACYNIQKYPSAISHFQKALEFNPKDTFVMEYLYYSFLLSGQSSKAYFYADSCSETLKSDIIKNGIDNINIEFGNANNLNYSNLLNKIATFEKPSISEVYRNSYYYGASIAFKYKLKTSITIASNYLNLTNNNLIELNPQNYKYLHQTNQISGYVNFSRIISKSNTISFAANLFSINKYVSTISDYSLPIVNNVKYSNSEYVLYFGLNNRRQYFSTNYFFSYSNINKYTQINGGINLFYFPLGNLNLYLASKFVIVKHSANYQNFKPLQVVIEPLVGFKIWKIWIEAQFTYGNIYNYNENAAYIIYNSTSVFNSKYLVNIIIPIGKKLELSTRLSQTHYINETSIFKSINNKNETIFNEIPYEYDVRSIIIGLKFRF